MSISPDDTFTYYLDEDKPEAERRGLVYRHGTAGDWRRFADDTKAAGSMPTEKYFDAMLELCKRRLVGWVNFPGKFNGAIEDHLTEYQIIEIVDGVRVASTLSEIQKKRLRQASRSTVAGSAPSADKGNATS